MSQFEIALAAATAVLSACGLAGVFIVRSWLRGLGGNGGVETGATGAAAARAMLEHAGSPASVAFLRASSGIPLEALRQACRTLAVSCMGHVFAALA